MRQRICILLILAFGLAVHIEAAQKDSIRTYTAERPLVYEDVWDLWPYSYLNERGEPEGFNVDLIRMLMDELGIPYVIKMKPSAEAFRDLKSGRSDLMLGLAVGFHDEFGHYSKNSVTLFTQSLVRPKKRPLTISRFHDLSNHQVIVNDSSLAHHLMIEYGWSANAQPVEDMREAIQQVSAKEEGQIVWNTLSLKWLMRRYHTDNLELTPVNMQHGQYKFMSNDTHLLDLLDKTYTLLYAQNRITPLQDKWFYPERKVREVEPWVWQLLGGSAVLLLLMSIYGITYRVQARRLTRSNLRRNKRLALIMETSHVHIWTYDVRNHQFAWRNEKGQIAYEYTMEEFAQRYTADDFLRLRDALDRVSRQSKDDECDVTLELKAKDLEEGDTERRDYYIVLSVLERDKTGHVSVILGTKKDVTEERRQQRLSDERTLRYWSIFYTQMVGIILFDKQGQLVNINPKACEMLCCDPEEVIDRHVSMDALFHTGDLRPEDADGVHGLLDDETSLEYQMMTVYDSSNSLLGVFVICHDSKELIRGQKEEQTETEQAKEAAKLLEEYNKDIDMVLHESDVRMISYSPTEHLLTVYYYTNQVQHKLTQTRCMTLVDDRSKSLAMRTLNAMDDKCDRPVHAHIHTTLRTKGHRQLCMDFDLMPLHDSEGQVTEYWGLLRDLSERCYMTMEMERQTAKVQEVENTKNSFVKNMIQEIRIPMETVTSSVSQLGEQKPSDNEAELRKRILQNSDHLLHLIDNILYLSRLEARMVEIHREPCDFAQVFESLCMKGWAMYQNTDTRYVVDNPYDELTVDIDLVNIGHAIEQLTANAAQHTRHGLVRARCEYIGRRLIISVDDTGEGIPPEALAMLQDADERKAHPTKGLGLAICQELVSQMGGTMDITSELGSGTTVYITIPCNATSRKRKAISNKQEQING